MAMPIKNTSGLKIFSEEKNRQTIEKANESIEMLKREKKSINFSTVATKAGLSKTTLYNNPQIRERIMGLRAEAKAKSNKKGESDARDKYQMQEEKIMTLRDKVRKLEGDKHKLIIQLVQMEELREENERLKKQVLKMG